MARAAWRAALGTPGATGTLPAPLESEIRRIYDRSPVYTARFPLHPEPLQWACYREIPTLSKKEIVENGHQSFFEDYRAIERGLSNAGRQRSDLDVCRPLFLVTGATDEERASIVRPNSEWRGSPPSRG